jgi:hypothetical protein
MQISARWVLPVTSTRRLRNSRSTSHSGAFAGRRHMGERDFQFIEAVVRASSMRGAWLVGPMNMPENR